MGLLAHARVERVVDPRSAAFGGNDARFAKDAKVMRDRRLTEMEVALDVAHTELLPIRSEQTHDLETSLVAECSE